MRQSGFRGERNGSEFNWSQMPCLTVVEEEVTKELKQLDEQEVAMVKAEVERLDNN